MSGPALKQFLWGLNEMKQIKCLVFGNAPSLAILLGLLVLVENQKVQARNGTVSRTHFCFKGELFSASSPSFPVGISSASPEPYGNLVWERSSLGCRT